ncbi:MAG TPA: hypothetical protein VMI13_12455, partial [Solirubrobacteraceae bacterium]|nr:hypothetical protein [Solirubrobacteraceae bacterium]
MSVRVFAPLMAAAALGLTTASVLPASAAASGSSTLYTCQKHGGKAHLAGHGGKCKSGETRTAWQSAAPSPKTSAIYTCKSSSGTQRLVSRATKCAKHERKLTWYLVKPSKSGTLGTQTVTPPANTGTPSSSGTPASGGTPSESGTPSGSVESPGFEVKKEQRIAGEGSFTSAPLSAEVGKKVEYKLTVKNTGNTTLKFSA